MIVLRPDGLLARTPELRGVEVLLSEEGGLLRIPAHVGKRILSADPSHTADLALMRLL